MEKKANLQTGYISIRNPFNKAQVIEINALKIILGTAGLLFPIILLINLLKGKKPNRGFVFLSGFLFPHGIRAIFRW